MFCLIIVFGKIQVLLYNLKCGLRVWRDFNLASLEKLSNHQILILVKISAHTVYGDNFMCVNACIY